MRGLWKVEVNEDALIVAFLVVSGLSLSVTSILLESTHTIPSKICRSLGTSTPKKDWVL